MNKFFLTAALALTGFCSALADVPSLKVTLNSGDVAEIELSTIKNITYQDATTMIVNYNDATAAKQFAISDVKNMVLSTFAPTSINSVSTTGNTVNGYVVYDLQGNVVAKGESADKLPSLEGQKAGVYVVKIGTRTVKITKN